ncbi:MAG: DUF5667 domain-containing protein [Minisyncoccota bacterium]
MPISLIIALIFAIGGGTSIAAEQSLPGDLLYPVKVHVNEPVRGAVAISDNDQAAWDTALANRRLEEAETLAAKGTLSTSTQAEIASSLNAHIDSFNQVVKQITEKQGHDSAATAEADLEATLSAHSQVLKALAAKPEEHPQDKEALISLASNVDAYTQAAASTRTGDEATIVAHGGAEVQTAAEHKLAAAEKKVTEVRSYISGHNSSVSASMIASANTRLALADQKIAAGKANVTAGSYTNAFINAQQAMSLAQEAKLAISTGDRLEIDLELDDEHIGSTTDATSTTRGNAQFRINVRGGDGNDATENNTERANEGDTIRAGGSATTSVNGGLRIKEGNDSGVETEGDGGFHLGL